MTPELKDPSYPLFGKIPIPPVMGSQLELVLTLEVLRPMRELVLSRLQNIMATNKLKSWFSIYLSCFVLLHSSSLATAYHYKYSRKHGVKVSNRVLTATSPLIISSEYHYNSTLHALLMRTIRLVTLCHFIFKNFTRAQISCWHIFITAIRAVIHSPSVMGSPQLQWQSSMKTKCSL